MLEVSQKSILWLRALLLEHFKTNPLPKPAPSRTFQTTAGFFFQVHHLRTGTCQLILDRTYSVTSEV